jgi:integrase
MVKRNPCRIKGAGEDSSAERPVLTVSQVFALADTISPRYRMLVLLASFTTLRFGELAALRRRAVDLTLGKSEAGKRIVAIPSVVLNDVRDHIGSNSEAGADGLVFVGPRGGQLRRRNFRRLWLKAVKDAKLPDGVHFHDLRHTGNHLAATNGASTKELMARMPLDDASRADLPARHPGT